MVGQLKALGDLVNFMRERSSAPRSADVYFDIEVLAKAVMKIPECKFNKVNFKIGSRYYYCHAKEKSWSPVDETEIFGETFDGFGFVIYSMERGGVKELQYFSDFTDFSDAFINRVLKEEFQLTSQQVLELCIKIE